MKRDMELIRTLILMLENSSSDLYTCTISLEGFSNVQIEYHTYLLLDAGLADGQRMDINDGMGGLRPSTKFLRNLTWEGHEFADASRNDSIWNKAMERVKEKGDTIPIGVLTMLLTSLLKSAFGLV